MLLRRVKFAVFLRHTEELNQVFAPLVLENVQTQSLAALVQRVGETRLASHRCRAAPEPHVWLLGKRGHRVTLRGAPRHCLLKRRIHGVQLSRLGQYRLNLVVLWNWAKDWVSPKQHTVRIGLRHRHHQDFSALVDGVAMLADRWQVGAAAGLVVDKQLHSSSSLTSLSAATNSGSSR